MAHQIKRVVLLFDRIVGYQFQVLLGIRRYAMDHETWKCNGADPRLSILRDLRKLRPDGIIVQCYDRALAKGLLKLNIPTVNVASFFEIAGMPYVGIDDFRVGQLAAEHLMDNGFRQFGLVPYNTRVLGGTSVFSNQRVAGFRHTLERNGFTDRNLAIYPGDMMLDHYWQGTTNSSVRRWLKRLPRPTGIFAVNDNLAMMVIEEAINAGRHVPEDLAVLGVDNDQLHCFFTRPPVSSIALPTERVGFEAATMLDALMSGEAPPTKPLLLAPLGVIRRQSTDVLAIADSTMAYALRFIREHATQPNFQINDLLASMPWSRRKLEKQFRMTLNRSPHDEITRIRIQIAKQLLVENGIPIQDIAAKAGFANPARLASVFKLQTGMTPSVYRKMFEEGNAG